MAGEIERLIGMLDDDSTNVAEEAKAELMSMGADVVGPLAAAVFSLQRYGQLSAIEILEHLGGSAAGQSLTDLLGSDHETVREWSAYAVATLGVRDAVPALQAAYRRQRASGYPPDFSEAVGIRYALTALGARSPVIPPLTASWMAPAPGLEQAWPVSRLEDVVNELAEHRQVVLYLQLWEINNRGVYWHDHDRLDAQFDWDAPWARLVEQAREAALLEVAFVPQRDAIRATVEWIDEADR